MRSGFLKLFSLSLAVLLLFSACSDKRESREFFVMDTFMRVTLYGAKEKDFAEISGIASQLENKYSATKYGSVVSALNRGESVNIDKGLCEMLEYAKKLSISSDGAYDFTILPVMEAYGFLGGEKHVPTEIELSEAMKTVGGKINISENEINLETGVRIDLGSCAKGYAGDMMIEYLKGTDIPCAVLSLGGSVHTYGEKPDGKLFTVELADPNSPNSTFAYIEAKECAIVTSGVYQRYFEDNGIRYHHIIDARTGRPAESGLVSVTVITDYSDSRAGMKADMLSTAMFLLGAEGCLEYYAEEGGFEAVMVTDEGEVIVTDGLKNSFKLKKDCSYTLSE